MNAADPQGSPSDRGGGSSCTPPSSDRGGGSSSTPPGAGSQPEVIEMDDSKAVLVITPALVYDIKGEVYALPADIVQAVDHFTVPTATEERFPRAVIHVLARSLRRPVRRGRQTQVLLLGGPHVPQKQDDGSLQKKTTAAM